MIITFWMYVYCLFDTPEQRLRMEARRLEQALKLYTADYKLLESKALNIKKIKYSIINKNDESRNY